MRKSTLVMAMASLLVAIPVRADVLVELSFNEKMEVSDVVIVGTVTAAMPGNPDQYNATATVLTLATLKGNPQAQHVVFTQSRIPEDNLQCCDVGGTYVMFLRRLSNGAGLVSANGQHGMIRIGPATNEPRLEVVPNSNR